MSSRISVKYYDQSRMISVPPAMTFGQILNNCCKDFDLDPSVHGLKHKKASLDLTCQFRLSSLPNNSTIEIVRMSSEASPKPVDYVPSQQSVPANCRVTLTFRNATPTSTTTTPDATISTVLQRLLMSNSITSSVFQSIISIKCGDVIISMIEFETSTLTSIGATAGGSIRIEAICDIPDVVDMVVTPEPTPVLSNQSSSSSSLSDPFEDYANHISNQKHHITQALSHLSSSLSSDDLDETKAVLITFTFNLLEFPTNTKFHRINLKNAKISRVIVNRPGGVQYLIGIGFQIFLNDVIISTNRIEPEVLRFGLQALQGPEENGGDGISQVEVFDAFKSSRISTIDGKTRELESAPVSMMVEVEEVEPDQIDRQLVFSETSSSSSGVNSVNINLDNNNNNNDSRTDFELLRSAIVKSGKELEKSENFQRRVHVKEKPIFKFRIKFVFYHSSHVKSKYFVILSFLAKETVSDMRSFLSEFVTSSGIEFCIIQPFPYVELNQNDQKLGDLFSELKTELTSLHVVVQGSSVEGDVEDGWFLHQNFKSLRTRVDVSDNVEAMSNNDNDDDDDESLKKKAEKKINKLIAWIKK